MKALSSSLRSCNRRVILPTFQFAVRPFHNATQIAKLLDDSAPSPPEQVTVNGFVRSVRSQKSHSFVALGDGSSIEPLQAVLPASRADGVTVGAAVSFTGSWVPSQGSGQSHELQVEQAQVIGLSDAKTFPIQKKQLLAEVLRAMPHLRTRTPFNSALLRLRSSAISALTRFFTEQHFVQAHTPIITSSDCEGAGEVFRVDSADQQRRESNGAETLDSFFRDPKYLTVSSQLHLEALAQSVGNVWTLSPTFRAERSDTSRHLSEFYMLEAEMAFTDDLNAVMDLLESMLRHLVTDLHEARVGQEILAESKRELPDLTPRTEVRHRWDGLMAKQWPRIKYDEAIDLLQRSAQTFDHKVDWHAGLQSEHEKYVAAAVGQGRPVFVTHFPRALKAFYMRATPETNATSDTQPERETVECFDLLVPDYCELAGGSMREHRLEPLLDAMRAKGLAMSSQESSEAAASSKSELSRKTVGSLEWYADLRKWGSIPHGGFGLGFDRLLAYLAGVQSIRDMVTFPRWHGRCDC